MLAGPHSGRGVLLRTAVSPYVHPGLLLAIACLLIAFCVVGGLVLLRHAPVVSLALFGAVVLGTTGFFLGSADGPRGVPAEVVGWASLGLVVAGAVGSLTMMGKPPASVLTHAAVGCPVALPFGALLLILLIQQACPLYVMRGAGYCVYDVDVLGAWASEVTFFFCADVLLVVVLRLVARQQAKRREVTLRPSP